MNLKIALLLAISLVATATAVQSAEENVKRNAAPVVKKTEVAPVVATHDRKGEDIVNAKCIECHGTGKNNSPRIGDQAAWLAKAHKGLDAMVLAAIRGHDKMPARGGFPELTDTEFRSAIFYMFTKSMVPPAKQ